MGLRARIRRTRREKEKVARLKDTPDVQMMRQTERGMEIGKKLAVSISFVILNRDFKLGHKRCRDILDICSNHMDKLDSDGIMFLFTKYAEKVIIAGQAEGYVRHIPENPIEHVYVCNKDKMFIEIISIICLALTDYGWSSNDKNTGRIDKYIHSVWREYKQAKPLEHYIQQVADKLGMQL